MAKKKAEIEIETIIIIVLFLVGISLLLAFVLKGNADLGFWKGELGKTVGDLKP